MGKQIKQTEIKEVIRSVVRENIKEVTTNDWHYKAIMAIWDKGGSFTRKKIGTILLKDPKADRRDVEDALRNSGYDEVTDVTDRLRIEGIIKEEDNIPGGLAKGMTLNDIAEKHGMSVDMLVAEFKKGIQTEMEHTTDREMAKEITMDHLFEDPQYYTKLATVEEYVDDKGVEHVAAALPQTEEEPIKEEESEETLEGLKEMAMGDLERIADYANMILERMGQGQNLDSWMYSQITLAVDQLNSVHDTMDGTDGKKEEVKEGKINEGAKRFYQLDYPNSKYVIYYYDGKTYYSDGYGGKTDAYETSGFLNKSQAEKLKKELIKKGYREDDRMRKESVNEEKVYIDYLNKQKGFKQDRIKFNSYEEAVKWAKKNFEKFNSDMIKYESVNEEKPGLWANIRAKQARGEKPAHGNSDAHKDAVKAGKEINNEEAVNELTNNERQIKTGNPNNVFYVFYKGQFEAVYWAMNPSDLFKIYWDKFKVRRPAGSKFKLNPEFIIVPKKEYDNSTSNRYAKLKPYVDKFWDKLQTESVNEATESDIIAQIKDIAKKHQNNIVIDPKSGKKMRVDAFSASAIATVYDALSDSSKEKFLASGLLGMQQMAMKLLKK